MNAEARVLPIHQFHYFLYFQLMDLLTTAAVLANGGREGNPVVDFILLLGPSPWFGLILVKGLAMALGVYCWKFRPAVLYRVNILFALIVAWNILGLVLGASV